MFGAHKPNHAQSRSVSFTGLQKIANGSGEQYLANNLTGGMRHEIGIRASAGNLFIRPAGPESVEVADCFSFSR
jgi:hypothetical protein